MTCCSTSLRSCKYSGVLPFMIEHQFFDIFLDQEHIELMLQRIGQALLDALVLMVVKRVLRAPRSSMRMTSTR